MEKITQVEKGAFLKLFNRGGYVLNFSTPEFDVFTLESVGVALCEKYLASKGKSLIAYVHDAEETDIIKLLKDLLYHYELHYHWEMTSSDNEYAPLYKRCRTIMDRIITNAIPLAKSVESLKGKFSSEYLSAQMDIMVAMQRDNPTEAIGKSKELIESCCKTILEANTVSIDKNWDVGELAGKTMSLLKITPDHIPDTAQEAESIKAILGNLRGIATNLATLRNACGSGHGKSANYKGLSERHAKLAVGSSITLVQFLWDSHERKNPTP